LGEWPIQSRTLRLSGVTMLLTPPKTKAALSSRTFAHEKPTCDRIEERQKFSDISRFGVGVPISFDSQGEPVATKEKPEGRTVPPDNVVQYSYHYDQYANWTERVAYVMDQPPRVTRRTLSYY